MVFYQCKVHVIYNANLPDLLEDLLHTYTRYKIPGIKVICTRYMKRLVRSYAFVLGSFGCPISCHTVEQTAPHAAHTHTGEATHHHNTKILILLLPLRRPLATTALVEGG